jgi:hypothetical protein
VAAQKQKQMPSLPRRQSAGSVEDLLGHQQEKLGEKVHRGALGAYVDTTKVPLMRLEAKPKAQQKPKFDLKASLVRENTHACLEDRILC